MPTRLTVDRFEGTRKQTAVLLTGDSEEPERVAGIGPKTLARLRSLSRCGDSHPLRALLLTARMRRPRRYLFELLFHLNNLAQTLRIR